MHQAKRYGCGQAHRSEGGVRGEGGAVGERVAGVEEVIRELCASRPELPERACVDEQRETNGCTLECNDTVPEQREGGI